MLSRRLLLASLLALSFAAPALAEEAKPDDAVSFDLSAEDWVATKTAHVTLDAEASVSAATSGTLRADMMKTVNDAAKADWKMTGFTRNQDQTGMERWSVTFDARLPESDLNGLADSVKKASKPGMQITVGDVDFTPTLDETESVRTALRTHILKEAADQLATLNASIPGRSYRIAQITFNRVSSAFVRPMNRVMGMSAAVASPPAAPEPSPDHAQKIELTAHVVYAALPPTSAPSH
ncbi:MAG: hypothetical protein WCD70_11090 [Alphaproteobacteria bacterium]